MTREEIAAFARRKWQDAERLKAQFWAERKAALSPIAAIGLGDDLRRQARAVRPDWPAEHDRADDLAMHRRVAEALRAVKPPRAR
jgi:hypothetical protein